MTLYAEWTRMANLVTGPVGSSSPSSAVFYYDAEGEGYYNRTSATSTNVSLEANAASGWSAVGWTKDPASTTATFNSDFTISASDLDSASTTYYAIGKRDLPLSYDANGATGTVPETQGGGEQVYNASGSQPLSTGTFTVADKGDLAMDGRVFAGWNTAADGSGTAYAAGATATVSEPTTLYAQWAYPVTYKVNGGKAGTAPADQSKLPGEDLTLHSGKPSRDPDTADIVTTLVYNDETTADSALKTKRSEAWTFEKWTTAADGSGDTYLPGATYKADEAATLYAQWKVQNPTYASTALPTPTRDGYTFKGWTTIPDISGKTEGTDYTRYEGGDTYTPTSDSTLYAQWEIITYDVTYKENGTGVSGMPDPATVAKEHGTDLTIASAPTRANKEDDITLTLNYKGGSYASGDDGNAFGATAHDSGAAKATTSYAFAGWDKSPSAAAGAYAAGGQYADNAPATLYAIWTPTVTGGTAFTLPTATWGSNTHEFKGWSTKPNAKKDDADLMAAGTTYTPTASTTLYAVWDPETYVIEYDGNADAGDAVAGVPASQSKEADQENVSLSSSAPTRTAPDGLGYTVSYDDNDSAAFPVSTPSTDQTASVARTFAFKGWNTDPAGGSSGTAYAAGDSIAATFNDDLKLYAQWEKAETVPPVTLPTPGRTGFTFKGWATDKKVGAGDAGIVTADEWAAYTASNTAYAGGASYAPSGDVTLYAQWEASTYTVTYDANAGTAAVSGMPDPASVPKTHGVDLPLSPSVPTRGDETGTVGITYETHGGSECAAGSSNYTSKYDFLSWKANDNTLYAPGSTYKANASTTLKADWAEETTYAPVRLPATTWEGHTFLGWFAAEAGGEKVGDAGDEYTPSAKGDVTLHAQWEADTYPVSYDMNTTDSTVSNQPDPNPATKTYGVDLALAGAPTRADEPNSSLTVTFDRRGGTGSPGSITSGAVTKHKFTGWNTQADGSGTAYEAGASYAGNAALQLYAQWEDTATGAEVALPDEPTPPTGFTFKGWSLSKDTAPDDTSGALLSPGTKVQPTGDVTYYAIYDPPVYIVSYDANGGTNAPADQVKEHGKDLDLSSGEPTRDGGTDSYAVTYDADGGSAGRASDSANATRSYAFMGWAEDMTVGATAGIVTDDEWAAYDDGKKHAGGDSYADNADLDLFAQWKETVTSDPEKVQLPTADRPGHTFLGWYDQEGNRVGGAGDDYALPGEDASLVAKWEAYTYPSDGVAFAYTVVFENPEDTQVKTQEFTFGESQALDAGTLTVPSGKVFAGWKLKGGSTTFTEHQLVSNLTNVPDGEVHLVATWKDAPTGSGGGGTDDPIDPDDPNSPVNPNGSNYYTVEYYEQDTDGTTYERKSKDWVFEAAGKDVAVPASALDAPLGFHVDWGETFASGTVASDNSTTLSVYWARNQFDVEFLPGATDATGTMDDQRFVWASGKKLNANAFSRPGYTFAGWKMTEKDGSLAAQSVGGLGAQSVVAAVALAVQALGESVADKADGSRLTSTDIGDGGHVTLTAQWVRDSSGDPSDPNGPNGPNGPTDPNGPNDPNGPTGPTDPSGPNGPNGPTDPNDPDGPRKDLEDLVKEAEDLVGPIGPEGPTGPQRKLLDEIDAAKKLLADPDATADQLRGGISRLADAMAEFRASGGNALKDPRVRAAAGDLPGTGDPMAPVSGALAAMLLLSAAAATIAHRLRARAGSRGRHAR